MEIKGFQDTIDWYNKNAGEYSQSIKNLPSIGLDEFVKLVPHGSTVLDAGCASGRDANLLVKKGIDTIGIDLSSKLIEIARRTYPNIKFVEGNFLHLPYPAESFGGVWAHASLLHFETRAEVIYALEEFNRVLTKDGVLHVMVKEKTNKKFDIVSDKLSGHNRFFQFFTQQEIKKYVIKTGFTILKLERCDDPAGRPEVKWILCLAKKP